MNKITSCNREFELVDYVPAGYIIWSMEKIRSTFGSQIVKQEELKALPEAI